MEITRRRVLSLLSATGLAAVLPAHAATAEAAPLPTGPAAGPERLLTNAVGMAAGTSASNSRAETAAKLAAVTEAAVSHLAAMEAAGEDELFSGLPLGTDDANLNTTFRRLYEIALATRTPGLGPLPGHPDPAAVQRRVIDALVRLHERYYGDQDKGYYGNWFNWEIGISTSATATLVLLADQLADQRPELTRTYLATMDAYLRNGKDGDVDLDSRFHTGANLADITTNRLLQGALTGGSAGEARIRKALEDQLTVYATVDPYALKHGVTDGYYADGSFIQHHSVAYTGSYGKGLLTRVVQTLKLLDGTGYADTSALVPVIHRWVADGFAPVIFEGWMMEIVKGRAVSRTGTGYSDTAAVAEAVTDLSAYAAGERATALKSYVKHLHTASRPAPDPARFVSPLTVVRYADLLADDSVPAADLNPAARHTAFNAMDKTVHRRPGYAFALSRSSERISKYEYMSGENLMPWFQGDGAHYLYLAGQDQTQAYGVDHFTTVSPYGLAGVTAPVERRRTVPELYGTPYYDNPDHPLHFTASSESQNTYVYFPRGTSRHSGGAVLDAYGAAGMVQSDDFAYADRARLPDDFTVYRNATATKSWFLLDEEIVVLAAGVGDRAGRAVTTTVDARIAAPDDRVTVTGARPDGTRWSPGGGSGPDTGRLRWLRYANHTRGTSVGYLFLGTGHPVTVALESVTRSRRVVRTANPDTAVTRQVFGASFRQAPHAGQVALAYALLPHATESALRAYGQEGKEGEEGGDGPLAVLANTPRLQAVRHTGLGLVAANSFTTGHHSVAGLRLDGPASVLVRHERAKGRHRGRITVAASDPTMRRPHLSVLLRGRRLTAVTADPGVKTRPVPGGTLLRFPTHHAYGRTFTVTLRER
ncbi:MULTISPECIES: polysaccharide lyase family 8 super-sandwich domain-containing protein [unclassified Streptomyces]|uniref:polysaccharide lyase family 8 super-sandwich domain-containing protein n=1 Tax=unclassified Streptomyces TaxID=2593676 RepID=UPI002DD82535|nr:MULTISPECIES: polysaccharide lyase family 8 super-sandwich domain-containing protein [unclassified Streptomyces]WSA91299.1 polysaccharide lyase beta-sandwich domain-containing protein [Streptomyces sp. NBC_01795]WSB75623.1 polysaccharide lyase beta-sandwich domain-containing protein [Streptomyces sp. NBC_01775]WSS44911.1 polysaccharide lyase beta-sandwich domain-containing protein [Streptomyces sp. NBC_01187]